MSNSNHYVTRKPMTADQVLEMASEIIASKYKRGETLVTAEAAKKFLQSKLGHYEREVFAVLLLDNQHRLIEYRELFFGTIDSASVYPREVVKAALQHNAAAVMFAHNHPSGDPQPSMADKNITDKLTEALKMIDIRVLDHIVVGKECVSFAELGLL
ncbi:RadC family protein [Marinomonas foliarum]|uniref:DNA repair protein RadC n=1 Tax=Marinomonas foliarum TaxID=491950 RepID=A0ABX7INY8_9GAMM|nr:DNA repair protein RadC [Marinomonas foliarum]QRV24057.1 DNA repair protein RadC [Marinomonas foliarum]